MKRRRCIVFRLPDNGNTRGRNGTTYNRFRKKL